MRVRRDARGLFARRASVWHAVALLTLCLSAAMARGMGAGAADDEVLPLGFSDERLAKVAQPTDLAFTPDGRMLITTQPGLLYVYQDGVLASSPALDLRAKICSNHERGMLGVAVDPEFASNGYLYLYYTFDRAGDHQCPTQASDYPVNRVSRFVLSPNGVIDPASETILLDNIPSPGGWHNAGAIRFANDGYLYVAVGDGSCQYTAVTRCDVDNGAGRDLSVLAGKILRITTDGSVPPSNPFTGPRSQRCATTGRARTGVRCQEIFASGLRNPFRIAFDPNAHGPRFFINDVGQGTWEEIDEGRWGADYGWNRREGHCAVGSVTDCGDPPQGVTNPIFDYENGAYIPGKVEGLCGAITGGTFVPNGVWPADFSGVYLYGDYVCGKVFRLASDGAGGYTSAPFMTGLGGNSVVDLTFGPSAGGSALYYLTYAHGGQLRRVNFDPATYRAPDPPKPPYTAKLTTRLQ